MDAQILQLSKVGGKDKIFKGLAEVYGKINLAQSYNYPLLVDKTRSLRILHKCMVRLT